jgi:hypothetical protein
MTAQKPSAWSEADVSAILRSEGIEPCEGTYQIMGGRPFFLVRDKVVVPYKTRDLGSVTIKDSVMNFKAVVVDEEGCKRGVGICYEMTKGGRGYGMLNCRSNYWDNPEDGAGIVTFLSELEKKK